MTALVLTVASAVLLFVVVLAAGLRSQRNARGDESGSPTNGEDPTREP